mgnify:CR=1 FL=1
MVCTADQHRQGAEPGLEMRVAGQGILFPPALGSFQGQLPPTLRTQTPLISRPITVILSAVWAPGRQHRREGLGALSGPGRRKGAGWTTSTPRPAQLGTRKPRQDAQLSAQPRGAWTTPLPGPCRPRPRPGGRHQTPGGGTALQHTTLGPETVPIGGPGLRPCSCPPQSALTRTARAPFPSGTPRTHFQSRSPPHPPRAVVSPAWHMTAAPGLGARLRSTTPASVRCSGECPLLPRDCRSRVTAARCPHAPAPLAAKMMCGGTSATQPATAET